MIGISVAGGRGRGRRGRRRRRASAAGHHGHHGRAASPAADAAAAASDAGAQPTAFDPASGTCGYADGHRRRPLQGRGHTSGEGGHRRANTRTLKTNRGDIVIQVLDAAKAPCTVNSFAFLADKKYFDNTQVPPPDDGSAHPRAAVRRPGQGPGAGGQGGPGYRFVNENLDGRQVHPRRRGHGEQRRRTPTAASSSSCTATPSCPPNYTLFGTVPRAWTSSTRWPRRGGQPRRTDGDGSPRRTVQIEDVDNVRQEPTNTSNVDASVPDGLMKVRGGHGEHRSVGPGRRRRHGLRTTAEGDGSSGPGRPAPRTRRSPSSGASTTHCGRDRACSSSGSRGTDLAPAQAAGDHRPAARAVDRRERRRRPRRGCCTGWTR